MTSADDLPRREFLRTAVTAGAVSSAIAAKSAAMDGHYRSNSRLPKSPPDKHV